MKKKKKSSVPLIIILILGVCIVLYPTVSNYYNSFHSSRAIASYAESVADMNTEAYERLWNEAVEYNHSRAGLDNPLYMSESDLETYLGVLDISGTGVMGYINIPKIDVELPIYHTTEESVLQIAVGHLEGTSLPVGGESSHCVLSGHRGLPSAKLFTHLDRLEEGDIFFMQILDETLSYEVDQIRIVLPTEVDDLRIEEGQDLCTLVTCTPYGINSHRLLVRGHRVANSHAAMGIRVTADALRIEPLLVAPVAAIPMLLVLLMWLLTGGGNRAVKTNQNRPARRHAPRKTKGGEDS